MLTKLLVYHSSEVTYGFAYFGDQLRFVVVDQPGPATEAIANARISSYNQAARSAFIECGARLAGFVNLPARAKVQAGSQLSVQLSWWGDSDKQPKFRYGWQLVGKYLVYTNKSVSNFLKLPPALVTHPALADLLARYPGEWIVRSSVRSEDELTWLTDEMAWLYQQGQAILEESAQPGIINPGIPNYIKLLRELPIAPDCELITNHQASFTSLLKYQQYWPLESISFDPKLDCQALLTEYQQLVASERVSLTNGASLWLATCAGINIIDVNSGSWQAAAGRLNFAVLDDIYRQICLRNWQGIILIDMVKNMQPVEQTQILDYLKRKFSQDITKTKVLGFSHSGLCEIIRNKF